MQEEKYAKAPLLYIQQPVVGESKVPMQHQYKSWKKRSNTKKANPVVEKEENVTVKPPVSYQSGLVKEEQPEIESAAEAEGSAITNEEATEQAPDGERRKHFKDMDTRGKLEYFANTSPYSPKVRCELRTEDRTYRGVVMEFENDVVVFKTMKRNTPLEIPLADVKDVRILGF